MADGNADRALRVAVVGARGRMGAPLIRHLRATGHEVLPFTRDDLNLTHPAEVIRRRLGDAEFDVLVNTSAMTSVDDCERDPAQAEVVNAGAARELARACREKGARMIQISTDFVFDGEADAPYREEDATRPINVYGETKLRGEEAVLECSGANLVVRVSWVYGPDKAGFPCWIVEKATGTSEVRVPVDKFACPTSSESFARSLETVLALPEACGILHLSDRGVTSWWEFGTFILELAAQAGYPVKTTEPEQGKLAELTHLVARRPAYSALNVGKYEALTGRVVPHWKETLTRFVFSKPWEFPVPDA